MTWQSFKQAWLIRFWSPVPAVIAAGILSTYYFGITGTFWAVTGEFTRWGGQLLQLLGVHSEQWGYYQLIHLEGSPLTRIDGRMIIGMFGGCLAAALWANNVKLRLPRSRIRIAQAVAGGIIDRYTWHDMFYIITALSAVVVLIGAFVLQKGGETKKDVTLDVPSVILSSLGFGGLLYGLSTIGSYGLRADAIAGTLVGAVALVFFFRRQLKMEKPMLQVRVLQNRKFLIATIIGMLVQGALLAAGILVPIYLQSLMGYSATVSGLVLLPGAIIMGAMGPIAGRLFDKHGPRVLALVGMGVLTLTTFCFAFLSTETGIITLTLLYTVRLFSLSLVNMPITTWGMNALDNELVNHGTSVNNTFRQVAGSLGTAIIVSASTIATNMSSRTMTPTQASIFGIDVAFALAGALCLVGFVMVVALVKNKPGEAAEKDRDNSRRTVLESIMKRDVYTLPANATVAEAMQVLVDRHISAAPLVDEQGKAVGFVSDGDIMRYLSKRSQMLMDPVVMIMQTVDADGGNQDFARKLDELMGMPAKSIGAKGIIGVDVHADLPEVCRVLGENHLKKVPVLDEGQVVGVINRSDITHYSMQQYLAERDAEAASKLERSEEAAALPDDEAVASSI